MQPTWKQELQALLRMWTHGRSFCSSHTGLAPKDHIPFRETRRVSCRKSPSRATKQRREGRQLCVSKHDEAVCHPKAQPAQLGVLADSRFQPSFPAERSCLGYYYGGVVSFDVRTSGMRVVGEGQSQVTCYKSSDTA